MAKEKEPGVKKQAEERNEKLKALQATLDKIDRKSVV
jgi:hypothetical protein